MYILKPLTIFHQILNILPAILRGLNDLLIIQLPITNVTKYQTAAHYAGIKIFNRFPTHIKCAVNEIQVFKSALKRFLLSNPFYSMQEYFNSNKQHTFQIVMF
jgi:hypothetical protein